MKKPTHREFLVFNLTLGFRFFESGTMRNKDDKPIGFYVKGDLLSTEMKEAFKNKFGKWVEFYVAVPEYAPELKKSVVLLRNAASFKN